MCDGTGVGVIMEPPRGPIPPTYTPTLFAPASFQSPRGAEAGRRDEHGSCTGNGGTLAVGI